MGVPARGEDRLRRSQAQERRGVKQRGGSLNAGSGNTPWRKGDHRAPGGLLIEYKRTDKDSITIKGSDLRKIFTEATLENRTPALGIEVAGMDWIAVPRDDFDERWGDEGR